MAVTPGRWSVVIPDEGTDPDVGEIATLVLSCPLVAGLHGGRHDRIATRTGDGRLAGVRVAGADLVIGVVGRPGATTGDIAAQVRSALDVCAPHHQVTVSVQGSLTSD